MSVGSFKNGLREGRGIVYHNNGKISIDGIYEHGKQVGMWKFYDEEGKVINVIDMGK
jgi:antitoxin component YwqK of YwqJK toxin-antitoxin module